MPSLATVKLADHADDKAWLLALLADLTALRALFAGLLTGSATWDAGAISDGDMESKDITVTGAALGDFVMVSLSIDTADLTLTGVVTAADTVTATLANNTGGSVNLASATVRCVVFPRAALVAPPALTATA